MSSQGSVKEIREKPDHYTEALRRFSALLDRARASGLPEPTAMTLATADAQGRPSSRTVLLKEVDERGFVFYTSLKSRKAQHLAANPRAALCFFWQPLMEQVLVEGTVEQVSDQEADDCWASRPRVSQLGWIPRPSFWSGFRVAPDRMEFWKRSPVRLHERVLYEGRGGPWAKRLLFL